MTFNHDLEALGAIRWQDVRRLRPEAGDRLLMLDITDGEMVAVYTGAEWVAAHDRTRVVEPTYVCPIPTCTWLPAFDPIPAYKAAGEKMLADPPHLRRHIAALDEAREASVFSEGYLAARADLAVV